MRWLLALLAAVLLGIPQAWADKCTSPDWVTTQMMSHFHGLRAVNLQGDDAKRFMAAFNALPPPSNWVADQAPIFFAPGNPNAELVLFVKGCMVKHGAVPADMLRPLVGDGA